MTRPHRSKPNQAQLPLVLYEMLGESCWPVNKRQNSKLTARARVSQQTNPAESMRGNFFLVSVQNKLLFNLVGALCLYLLERKWQVVRRKANQEMKLDDTLNGLLIKMGIRTDCKFASNDFFISCKNTAWVREACKL